MFAGLAVRDYPSARVWYERLFGRPPDMLPHEHEAVWRLTDTASVYVVADPARAGTGLLTVAVDDFDELLAGLAARGLAPRIEMVGDGVRKAVVGDPDGNEIAFFAA